MRYKLHQAKSLYTSNYLYLISDNDDMVGAYWFSLDIFASHTQKYIYMGNM